MGLAGRIRAVRVDNHVLAEVAAVHAILAHVVHAVVPVAAPVEVATSVAHKDSAGLVAGLVEDLVVEDNRFLVVQADNRILVVLKDLEAGWDRGKSVGCLQVNRNALSTIPGVRSLVAGRQQALYLVVVSKGQMVVQVAGFAASVALQEAP